MNSEAKYRISPCGYILMTFFRHKSQNYIYKVPSYPKHEGIITHTIIIQKQMTYVNRKKNMKTTLGNINKFLGRVEFIVSVLIIRNTVVSEQFSAPFTAYFGSSLYFIRLRAYREQGTAYT